MNDRIFSNNFDKFFNTIKSQLPKDLTQAQFEEIALYAAIKLDEAKQKSTKIIFNPKEDEAGGSVNSPTRSSANNANIKYKSGNRKF